MDDAERIVEERLERIEELREAGAQRSTLLDELRDLLGAGEALACARAGDRPP